MHIRTVLFLILHPREGMIKRNRQYQIYDKHTHLFATYICFNGFWSTLLCNRRLFRSSFFKEGFVGVSFFFVLSGFIIAYNYQKKLSESKMTKRSFWVARIARIYPLHVLTLLIAAALGGYVIASGFTDWSKHFWLHSH